MSASIWTDDRIDRLKALWSEGQTAAQVSRDLGHGITRSAVLGKVHRLGLSAGRTAVPDKVPPRAAPASSRRPAIPAVQADVEVACVPQTGAATLQSVGRHQCRWPLSAPGSSNFRVCGRPVARGAYCGPHGGIAYRPVREAAQALERLARLN